MLRDESKYALVGAFVCRLLLNECVRLKTPLRVSKHGWFGGSHPVNLSFYPTHHVFYVPAFCTRIFGWFLEFVDPVIRQIGKPNKGVAPKSCDPGQKHAVLGIS